MPILVFVLDYPLLAHLGAAFELLEHVGLLVVDYYVYLKITLLRHVVDFFEQQLFLIAFLSLSSPSLGVCTRHVSF